MLKRLLTLVVIFGLVSCGERGDTPRATTESTDAISPAESIDVTDLSKKEPLNLKVSTEGSSVSGEEGDFSEKKVLPDLFDQKKKEQGKTTINGKLLNDPSNPDYIDSVEGAEVSIKFRTD